MSKARRRALKPPKAKPPGERGRGRPPYKPTPQQREQVKTLVGLGMREDEIATFLDPPCAPNTLRLHFRRELDMGLVQAKVQTLSTLHRMANGTPAQYYPAGHPNAGQLMTPAMPPDKACLIFKCKTQYGLRDTILIGGDRDKGAKPVALRIEDLTEDQLVQLIARLEGLAPQADNDEGVGGDGSEGAD